MRRACAVAAACLGLVLATPVLAWAHATLVSSEPAVGGRVAASPMRVRLAFSEELEPSLGRISLVGADGKVVKLVVSGDPHDVNALIAPLHAPLQPGAYRVLWRVVSSDGHPVDGSFVFTVGDGGTSAATGSVTTRSAVPPVPEGGIGDERTSTNWGPSVAGAPFVPALLRGLGVGTLMAAAGLFFILGWTDPANEDGARRPAQLARRLAMAFSVLLPLHALAWAMNASPEHQLGGEMLTATLSSGVGRVELWRTGLALVAGWAYALARRPRVALLFAFLALLVSGATGHSAALYPLWTTPAKALHLVAGAMWIGGLLWLLTFDRSDPARYERQALRVSSIALAAVIVVTFSGVVQWRFFLPTLRGLFDSAYGVVMSAKIAGLLVLVGFGAHHKFRAIPRLQQNAETGGGFATTLRREVVVMTIVLLLGGLLGYLPPPEAMQMHDSSSHTMEP